MQRTISAMVGKGSVNHNSRKFKAENVDADRSHLNIDYCNESIKKVYHELFDEALERYNAKQTRTDRKIANYYEKIRSSKQEKPFHELILQIGDKENMSAESENGQLARQVLDEYYRGFQERNPQLRVFSAHLHLDEATPHLHIDFVPFTTGSKRGLDTRVSLKQALAAQGFKGGSRGDTEWSQWVLSEKERLAAVMERYGIEWEQKGTHEKHLSVLDYKKQERAEEIEQLESKIIDKQTEFETLSKRIQNFDKGTDSLSQMQSALENAPEYQLPEPQGFMTAKSYKSKVVEPLIKRLKSLIKTLMVRCFQAIDDYQRLNQTNASLYRSNEKLKNHNKQLTSDNNRLREEIKDYFKDRMKYAWEQVVSTAKKVAPYVLIGVGIGAIIHNWIPEDLIVKVLGDNNPFGVVLATIAGVPMYADIFGTIPIAEALLAKGALLGVVLSFMMGVTTLSLPSMIMLRKAVKSNLLGIFIAICTVGIIVVGYFFNAIQYLIV